jgi:hypothetical protein
MSPRTHDPPERPRRSGNGEPGKRAARACTKPTSGHNLAFLIRARPPGRALARTTRPNELKRAPSNDPPERPRRSDKGEPGKRAARACTKPTSGHNLAFLIRARPPGRALARTTRPNEFKRAPSNDPHERPSRSGKGEPGKRAARACTKPTSGHNLAFLIRARPPGRALARTTRPNEFTRAPSHDPPERPRRSDKGEPGKRAARACTKPTSGHNLAFLIRARPPGRALARTTRPNEFNGAPSNDPPERVQQGALKRPARTTETKRQGRAGQTSCTSVHKANLGSQLSIFDTGSSARARPRPNDPPERVQPCALKRPARTTETKRQGRAGQTSCTSVHKANLGSQLSIFDTGSSARARPRPKEFTRAPSNDPPERPKRSDKGEPGKRAARACTKPTSGHNLAFLIRARPPGRALARTTRPNEFTRARSKRPARTTETKRQGRAGQTSCTSVHKANLGSQLSIFDTGSSAGARPRPNDPPELVHAGARKRPARTTETKRQGRAGQTSCTSVHKANLGSQLSIFDTGSSARARPRPNDPPERVQPGALKRPARTTETKRQGRAGQTSCTSVHKANLGSQLSIFDTGSSARARPRPNEFTRAPSNDPPERPKRSDKGEPGKRAARACTKPTSGHNLAFLIRARPPGRALARTTRPNEFNRAPANDPPERPKRSDKGEPGKRAARACTNPTSGHNLAFLIRARPPGRALARTTRPNEFTRAPSNDPPERPKRSDKGEASKRAARACTKPTSGHNLAFLIRARPPGRALARTTRPNEFNRAPSNDPPERPKRSDKGEPGKRAARACTKPTSGHNLAFLIRARPPGRALARTTRPNEFTRAPSNDPPERPKRSDKGEPGKRAARACTKPTSGHNLAFLIRARPPGRALARTTRPNEFTRAPSNDPPERPKRSDKGEPGKRAARACTKPTSGHNLAFLIRARPPGRALARTDPPERVHPGALKRPARTTETKRQGRAGQTSCTSVHKANLGSQLSIFDTGSSARARPRPNDPPERVQPGALKRPARTTETKRQGRAGQTSCTSVHKANLGSQLSIFDTGSSARARPRPNDPPERVHPGALKRPARTTETKRQGRAGQTSCTSVHKANLGSQLSIFDTGSSARARPRPNGPPERVHPGALKRPARTTETKRQGRAGQTSCTSVHKANLGSQLSIFDTGSSARARPRPNDPPERVHPGALKRPARTTETKRQGRAGQTSCTSVHKANLGSQLSIFDTGSSARARPRPNGPPERVHPGALKRPARTTETKRQGRAGQTSCTSVHKANLGSQLSIFDTGSSARARPRPNDPPERVHPGALKRPARTTETKRQGRAGQTSCTSVHKANLGSQLSIFDTGSSARARPRPNDPPERVHF